MSSHRRTPLIGTCTVLCSIIASPAAADLTAYFRAESIDGGCLVDDHETALQGDPDRHFRMGIFDDPSLSQTCAAGCSDDGVAATLDAETLDYCTESSGCGVWNFLNQTVSKPVPDAPVYFYFGLWDNDPGNASDSLGDHWFFTGLQRSSRTDLNNNSSPYYADTPISTVCGEDVAGAGNESNFYVTYSTWYTDGDGPILTTPYNQDDTLDNVHDNDTRLDYRWAAATDPDSGIDAYSFTFRDVTTNVTLVTDQTASFTRLVTICPSGCTYTYTPVHNHQYQLRVSATNGSYPEITNPTKNWSSYSQTITVDLMDPTATIAAPSADTWHNGDITVDFVDADDGVGVDTTSCEWQVTGGAVVTRPWGTRTCNATRVVTVGATGDCNLEGANTCLVETSNSDLARRNSLIGSRTFGIDWTEDTVGTVEARTNAAGAMIGPFDWTTDRDPYFTWPPSTSTAPIAGYSWAMDASPDCGSTEVPGAGPEEVQLTTGVLADGVHEFQVRAVDEAGNCGPVTTRTVQVDATPDTIANLRATDGAGVAIAESTWQQENRPTMIWDPAPSSAPIVGYSFGTGAATDCTVDTPATTTTLMTQSDGIVRFWVRAVDAAGNCGPAATFELYIDTVADPITNLRAWTQQGGTAIMSGVSQPDADPYMEWDIPLSTSSIAGYSWGTGTMTDCTIETVSPNAQLSALPDGSTTFWVRAVDEAGNCGPASTFVINVGSCGDGIVNGSEECDDGNDDSTDACVACMNATCGDGEVWAGNEDCDDGVDNSDTEPDACRTTCVLAYCGDGVVDMGEGCDEGDQNGDTGTETCRTTCALATCGDGVVDTGEECDDGALNSDTDPDACRTMCLVAFCGDGVLDMMETCDDGMANSDADADACRTTCALPTCGDGVVDLGEMCDDGQLNSDTEPDACRATCVPASCGDGVVDSNEVCEPGEVRGDQICLDDCQFGPLSEDMGNPQADMGGSMPDASTGMPDAGGNPTAPDMGTVTPGTPDAGQGGGGDSDPVLVDSGVSGCCGVAASRTFAWWQLLLAAGAALLVRRRRS